MTMIPVSSSNLSAVGYENGILYIRFHGGQLYRYYNVPEVVYRQLMSAPHMESTLRRISGMCIGIASCNLS